MGGGGVGEGEVVGSNIPRTPVGCGSTEPGGVGPWRHRGAKGGGWKPSFLPVLRGPGPRDEGADQGKLGAQRGLGTCFGRLQCGWTVKLTSFEENWVAIKLNCVPRSQGSGILGTRSKKEIGGIILTFSISIVWCLISVGNKSSRDNNVVILSQVEFSTILEGKILNSTG